MPSFGFSTFRRMHNRGRFGRRFHGWQGGLHSPFSLITAAIKKVHGDETAMNNLLVNVSIEARNSIGTKDSEASAWEDGTDPM